MAMWEVVAAAKTNGTTSSTASQAAAAIFFLMSEAWAHAAQLSRFTANWFRGSPFTRLVTSHQVMANF